MVAHRLLRDEELLSQVVLRYQVPQPAGAASVKVQEFGPEIDWRGPTEQVQLQSWLIPEPDFQDVGFLKRAIERAASVCRVEFPHHTRRGTGFLIAPDLVLTNYHVLKDESGEDLETNARSAVLLFGKITAEPGKEAEGQGFRLVEDQPVVSASPVEQLDYALLRVETGIQSAQGIAPAPFSLQIPARGDALHILQHPEGRALQLAVSGNGVEYIAEERGLVQYSTRAAGGSSGSPCFSDHWEVVAIHHAQRSKGFGIVREGILFTSIHELIKGFF
jgi:hypothetical protein